MRKLSRRSPAAAFGLGLILAALLTSAVVAQVAPPQVGPPPAPPLRRPRRPLRPPRPALRLRHQAAPTAIYVDTKPRKAIVLSMRDAVKLTLENSMDIKVNRIAPQVAAAAIEQAESRFDWTFVGQWSHSHNSSVAPFGIAGTPVTVTKDDNLQVGLKKQLITGGEIDPTLMWDRTESNTSTAAFNPTYTSEGSSPSSSRCCATPAPT